jgi:hypothetical protein
MRTRSGTIREAMVASRAATAARGRRDTTFVIVEGGRRALAALSKDELRQQQFTIVEDAAMPANDDWVAAADFVSILEGKRTTNVELTPPATRPGSAAVPSARVNYAGTATYTEIVRISRREGARVVVGFDGGRRALRESDGGKLRARTFKWDWVDRPTGVKTASHWIPGDEFLAILEEIGALAGG